MLAESPQITQPTPSEFLDSINAGSAQLQQWLTTSGASDIYSDLTEYVDTQYQELVHVCGDDLITRHQAACWLETRTEQIRQKSIELANEQDIRVDFSSVRDSPTSMVFWNAGSMYSGLTGSLRQQLGTLSVADITLWLNALGKYIDTLAVSNEHRIEVLEQESKEELGSCTAILKSFPGRFSSKECEALVKLIESSFQKRMKIVVLGFASKIYLDLLARSYDFFLHQPEGDPLVQEALLAVENWEVSDA
ncbi:hypothetical protein C1752_10575 [Acaryochloris thomasi RCC1774]|uniref:Uncharacterized protein n=1 Tax=Acaryochloris thomasi RCC1774 TaxID=1764569 RepID=A0A2W1J8W8_9CYAN|nr:hypothetical protein [Acaryochloris thomasi]PZD70568.1 hypothetical protein C1752_10575 [Acaryochloris thomasi RCC1774]